MKRRIIKPWPSFFAACACHLSVFSQAGNGFADAAAWDAPPPSDSEHAAAETMPRVPPSEGYQVERGSVSLGVGAGLCCLIWSSFGKWFWVGDAFRPWVLQREQSEG